jgi:tetratricopeptide (TPR) repeat protein
MTSEAVILAIGTLSALTGLQGVADLKTKKPVFKVLFFASIATAIAMNAFQYSYAVTNKAAGRKEVENSTAIALAAFERNDLTTLRAVAPNSFLVGYRLFKNGKDEEARTFFEQCVRKDEFTAPSKYLLAFLMSHTNRLPRSDVNYTEALKLLEEVTKSDPEYSPAYYLTAKLLANRKNTLGAFDAHAAIEALEKAVYMKNGYTPCRDINNLEEVKKFFSELDPIRLTTLQNGCRLVHNLPTDTATPTPTPTSPPPSTPTLLR